MVKVNISKKKSGLSVSHDYSPIQEKKSAKEYGGELVVNSGRGESKGDWTLDKGELLLMFDDKATKHSSYSLKRSNIEKLEKDALRQGRLPILHVELQCNTPNSKELFICPKWVFDQLLG